MLHHLPVALGLLQHLECWCRRTRPAQCLVLQLQALARAGEARDPDVLQSGAAGAANRWSCWQGATCANWPSCATARASRCARHWR